MMRSANDADAPALVDVWSDVLRRGDRAQQVEDVGRVIDRVSAMPEERIVVAEVDGPGRRRGPPQGHHVQPDQPRAGRPGDLAARAARLPPSRHRQRADARRPSTFAEELGIGHVGTAVSAGARDSNRFMARLGARARRRRSGSRRPARSRAGSRRSAPASAARRRPGSSRRCWRPAGPRAGRQPSR